VTLDTVVLLQTIPAKGRYRAIIEAFAAGRIVLVVSNEILLECEEILKEKGGITAWEAFRDLLDVLANNEGSLRHVYPTYFWKQILSDRSPGWIRSGPDDTRSEVQSASSRLLSLLLA